MSEWGDVWTSDRKSRIFLPLRFYVKSISVILEAQKLPFFRISGVSFVVKECLQLLCLQFTKDKNSEPSKLSEWMSEWKNMRMRMRLWVNEWIRKWENLEMSEWEDEWMMKWVNEKMRNRVNKEMSEWEIGWMMEIVNQEKMNDGLHEMIEWWNE